MALSEVTMKKYFNLILVLFLSSCVNSINHDEFVNPIFSQPLEPGSQGEGRIYLTPVSIDMRTPKDKNKIAGKGECKLVENIQDKITLKCSVKWTEYATYEDAQKLLSKKEIWAQELGQDILKKLSSDYHEDWYFSYEIKERQYSQDYICMTMHSWLSGEPEYKSSSLYCVFSAPSLFESD